MKRKIIILLTFTMIVFSQNVYASNNFQKEVSIEIVIISSNDKLLNNIANSFHFLTNKKREAIINNKKNKILAKSTSTVKEKFITTSNMNVVNKNGGNINYLLKFNKISIIPEEISFYSMIISDFMNGDIRDNKETIVNFNKFAKMETSIDVARASTLSIIPVDIIKDYTYVYKILNPIDIFNQQNNYYILFYKK